MENDHHFGVLQLWRQADDVPLHSNGTRYTLSARAGSQQQNHQTRE